MAGTVTPHRSRTAWQQAPQTPAGATTTTHDHRLPRRVRLILIGLVVAVIGLTAAVVVTGVYVWQAAEYVQGTGEYRDAEAERIEQQAQERIRRAICDLLDELPEGGLLERPRAKYGCGPGVPLAEFPPEVAERFRPEAATPPLSAAPPPGQRSAPVSPSPEPSRPAQGGPKPSENSPPSSGTRPQGEPSPAPPPAQPAPPPDDGGLLDDLTDPLTGPVCDLTSICL
jgi:hypothetical protein